MQKTKSKSAINRIFILSILFLSTSVFAQINTIKSPTFSAKTFPNGILYSFFEIADDEKIKYRLYDPLSASSAEGYIASEGSLFVETEVTATAWIEKGEQKSLPVVLYPQQELPFANIDSAFISPVEGEWANKQALVMDIPSDYEAYYSFTSTDPLVSGLAYDGPVLIDMNGVVTVTIALVAPNETVYNKSITYSVSDYAAFQPFSEDDGAVIDFSPATPISIPENMAYYFGNEESIVNEGKTLSITKTNDIIRYVPLVIVDNNEKYRYVVQTGEQGSGVRPLPSVSGIEFFNWEFFSFDLGSSVSYSIDNSPWVTYINPVYIDRSEPHTISWTSAAYYDGKVQHITVPPKPKLVGIPQDNISSKSVTITADDTDFVFRYETAKHKTDFLSSVYFDVLPGEKYTFSTPLSVYYKGIKQGSLKAAFTIDKQVPVKPQFITDSPQYATNPVQINIDSEHDIFVRISKKPIDVSLGQEISYTPVVDTSIPFMALPTKTIELSGDVDGATFYTIQAFTQSTTGTRSAVATYTICVDTYSLFVSNTYMRENDMAETGSPLQPYSNINTALAEASKRKASKIFIEGSYTDVQSFSISGMCTLFANESAELEFADGATMKIDGGELVLQNIQIMQSKQDQTLPNSPLITVNNGKLAIQNTSISYFGPDSQTLILSNSSLVSILNAKINATAFSYCAVVDATDSNITIKESTVLGTASAVELFNITDGDLLLSESDCTTSAGVGRIASLFDANYSIHNNTFTKKDGTSRILQQAVQVNKGSFEHDFYENKLSGFKEGLLQVQ